MTPPDSAPPDPLAAIFRRLPQVARDEPPPPALLHPPFPGHLIASKLRGNMASDWWEALYAVDREGEGIDLQGWVYLSAADSGEDEPQWFEEAKATDIQTGLDLYAGLDQMRGDRFGWVDFTALVKRLADSHPEIARDAAGLEPWPGP